MRKILQEQPNVFLFDKGFLFVLAAVFQLFAFNLNANHAETFYSTEELNLENENLSSYDDFTCNSISFTSYKEHDPVCGESNGAIKVTVDNPNNYCLVYRLYNYTTNSWHTGYQTSRLFKDLPAGKYRVKMYVDNNCNIDHPSVTCYTPSEYLNLGCENLCSNELTVNNNGDCATQLYWWVNTGDQYKKTLQPGESWTTTTYDTYMWRAINDNPNWGNLLYDEHLTVSGCSTQTWNLNPDYCATDCSGNIDNIILTNGSESVTLQNGGTYQLCDLPTNNYLEAVVSGSHESFKFTVNGDDRTENAVPYNYPAVSNGTTWNPGVGSHTITGKLYTQDNLGGNLCEEININITIEDCGTNDPCGIDNIILTNGSESVTLQNGGTYQLCDLPTNNYLEAVVSGSHESFKFIVNGDDRAENSEPYNYPAVSNGSTWNPFVGSYTITGKLYTQDNLGGNLCEEVTINITIEDCASDPCNIPNNQISGFIYLGEYNGSKYFCSQSIKTWSEAVSLVQANGGEIAIIDDANENHYLASNIQASAAWIGYTDKDQEGSFEWYNGATSSYTNWKSGEPNDIDPTYSGADYAVIEMTSGKWYDRNGHNAYEVIMEIKCGTSTEATIGDFVFNDINGNGIQETGEFGLLGVTVMLLNDEGNMVDQTTTNDNGNYEFTGVEPGDYKLKFPTTGTVLNLPYILTEPNQGGDDTDSDPVAMQGSNDAMTAIFTVNAGDNIDNIDAGYYFASTIKGIAFEDINGNGIQENDEPNINGILVMLLDENGDMVDQVTTADNGTYTFDNLAPGSYKVKFPVDANISAVDYTLTLPNQGDNDNIDSDAVPMDDNSGNAMTEIVSVANGQTIDNLDAGYFNPASVGDFVFEDKNGNGIQDNGEEGIEGVTVMLLKANGDMVDQTTTGSNGEYSFTSLPAGDYKVKFPAATTIGGADYALTAPNQGGSDDLDSDAVEMNDGSGNAMTEIFALAAGEDKTDIDAGYFILASLGNYVFLDNNQNGIQDVGDEGVDGIPVILTDRDGTPLAEGETTDGGFYTFEGLTPGLYKVIFPSTPAIESGKYILTLSNVGTNDDLDSDAIAMDDNSGNAMSEVVTIQSGDDIESVDAGYIKTAQLGDFVFNDKNENGLQDINDLPLNDVLVTLTGTDIFGRMITETTTTDDFGAYRFQDLTPGTYSLEFTSPFAFLPTPLQDVLGNGFDDRDSDIDQTGKTDDIVLEGGDINKTIDAGFIFDASLPVALTSFEAQLVNGNEVILKWTTASEENNEHFVVERSNDGRVFEQIGVVAGNGTTNSINHYSLNDTDPFFGYNYYRLKQVDFDGAYEYSNVETVIISGNDLPDVIVYPNPVVRTTTLRVVTPFETDAKIEIVNQAGQIIKVIEMEQGANSKQIDLSGYTAGMYFAYINYNGHRTLVHNIVKIEE